MTARAALKVHSISLGCPKNRVDTERVLGRLGPVTPVPEIAGADLVFINTCGFISPAIEESVRVILEAAAQVSALPAKKRPLLAVAGCLVGRFGRATLAPDLPEADLLLESADLARWPQRILAALKERGPGQTAPKEPGQTAPKEPARPLPADPGRLLSTGPSYAWLKISEGCRHQCAFCSIPAIRGPLASLPAEELENEARSLLDKGVKELIVVAQDITAWGSDLDPARRLEHLLERLLPLPGLEWLRLMYMYPAGLDERLLTFLKNAGPPFVPYFDVPVQHAAKNVLSRMGRPFAGNPLKAVRRIREHFPEAALRTSIIVGFPGETEKDFDQLCAFVRDVRFHHLGVFPYYPEEGTPAATMPGQLPDEVKQWRKDHLMALQREISAEIMESYLGSKMRVLVDRPNPEWPGLHEGRVWFQAPEVDGLTYVSGPGVTAGAMLDADIVDSSDYDLTALA